MTKLIEFLIVSLQTLCGKRNTAKNYIDEIFKRKTKSTLKQKLISMVSDQSFDEDRFVTE